MVRAFEIKVPLPSRGSAVALREQLVEHLVSSKPQAGARFLSDHELARVSGLSRPTVRRALHALELDGWIERRPGIGTFIGPRVGFDLRGQNPFPLSTRRGVKLALMIHMLGDLGHDWYASGVIAGIDRAAEETGVTLELLGNHDGDVKSASRRLMKARPDVLAFAAPPLWHTTLIGEARRLDIHCIGTGTLLERMGVPSVCEDGFDAASKGVAHLVEHGHRQIGFVSPPFSLPWVFQRRAGYMQGMTAAGLEADEGMVLWMEGADEPARVRALERYLDKYQPTALLLSSWVIVPTLAQLVRTGKVSIPKDLSIVTFDQHPTLEAWLGVRPTTLNLPLIEMGRRLALMSRDLGRGGEASLVQSMTTLPCELTIGNSVARR